MSLPPGHSHESWAQACAERAATLASEASQHLMLSRDASEHRKAAELLQTASTGALTASQAIRRFRQFVATNG